MNSIKLKYLCSEVKHKIFFETIRVNCSLFAIIRQFHLSESYFIWVRDLSSRIQRFSHLLYRGRYHKPWLWLIVYLTFDLCWNRSWTWGRRSPFGRFYRCGSCLFFCQTILFLVRIHKGISFIWHRLGKFMRTVSVSGTILTRRGSKIRKQE